MIDPLDSLAHSLHIAPGTQALLVGSGLSQAAGILTGWEITIDLIKQLAASQGVEKQDNWEQWFSDKYRKSPNYSEVLAALATTQAERQLRLRRYIEETKEGEMPRPTKAHHAIAQLVKAGTVRVIITTNFDHLLETALREAGIPPTVIASDDAIQGATSLFHSRCTVIKVHGDYLDVRIKNTDAELDGYSSAMNGLLDLVFDNFGLVVVGWSGQWDKALRNAIKRVQSWRYPLYWAARGGIGDHAKSLLEQSDGKSFEIEDADVFFSTLDSKLMALQQTSQQNPQSVAAAIALAKRYCRDDKFAMEWAEFLHAEVEKIRGYVTGPNYPKVQRTVDTRNEVVNSFMVRTEVLRRACLICGKWGTSRANQSVIQAIKDLSFANESLTDFTAHVSLQAFAASVCFYWSLTGLFDNKDWQSVSKFFLAEAKYAGTTTQLVSVLHPDTYDLDEWKFLVGYERRRTRISDFLFEKLKSETNDVSISEMHADELFDDVEFFVSLEFAHQRRRIVETTGAWFWVPSGRFIWKNYGKMWSEKLTQIEKLLDSDPIYKAGLLGGSSATAKPTIQAVRERYGNIRIW